MMYMFEFLYCESCFHVRYLGSVVENFVYLTYKSHCIISKRIFVQQHEISYNVACATSKASDQPELTCSLIRAFASRLDILLMFSY